MRTGNPCSYGSGAPFMPTANSASRPSLSAASGVEALKPSELPESTMSASGRTPARRSTSITGTPSQVALPASVPPTSLETHVRVSTRSTSGSPSRSR